MQSSCHTDSVINGNNKRPKIYIDRGWCLVELPIVMDEIVFDMSHSLTNSVSADHLHAPCTYTNNKRNIKSVAGSPASTSSKMSLTAAAVAAASAAAAASHKQRGCVSLGDVNNHNQWEVVSSSSTSSSISRQNSMECWDYTIELECLQGPEGCCANDYYFLILNFSPFPGGIALREAER